MKHHYAINSKQNLYGEIHRCECEIHQSFCKNGPKYKTFSDARKALIANLQNHIKHIERSSYSDNIKLS